MWRWIQPALLALALVIVAAIALRSGLLSDQITDDLQRRGVGTSSDVPKVRDTRAAAPRASDQGVDAGDSAIMDASDTAAHALQEPNSRLKEVDPETPPLTTALPGTQSLKIFSEGQPLQPKKAEGEKDGKVLLQVEPKSSGGKVDLKYKF